MADLPAPLGESPAFRETLARVSQAAPLDRPVLVIGERGTGKELVAARLHYLSRRWDGPFVQMNCAALAPALLETELFGHEAGAFTGATRRREGRFALADGGTLFLDELANASLAVQEKILRVVEYGSFERVGGAETVRTDVRLVAATNVDLPGEVRAGRFRADLLDRLAFEVITLPPLRARREDIRLLAEHFAVAMARELSRPFFAGFAPAALAALEAHPWPGNVRELKNVVERAVYRTPEGVPVAEITLDPFASPWAPAARFPEPVGAAAGKVPGNALGEAAGEPEEALASHHLEPRVRAYERRLIVAALLENRHNRRKTAGQLGLTYDQLRGLIRRHRLDGGPEPPDAPEPAPVDPRGE